jgi:serine protease Do
MEALAASLSAASSEIFQRATRSIVHLQNGRLGVGAGIIWGRDHDGNRLILTNHHIGFRCRWLQATLSSGAMQPVELVAKDEAIDLALYCLESSDAPSALIADSRSLLVGQLVFAIGHPWGERNMVTSGLVSSLPKMPVNSKHRREVGIIRSDVRLAPGNSGGPLVNANGAVIGITTMIMGGDQSIAIPSHVASLFCEGVLDKRKE